MAKGINFPPGPPKKKEEDPIAKAVGEALKGSLPPLATPEKETPKGIVLPISTPEGDEIRKARAAEKAAKSRQEKTPDASAQLKREERARRLQEEKEKREVEQNAQIESLSLKQLKQKFADVTNEANKSIDFNFASKIEARIAELEREAQKTESVRPAVFHNIRGVPSVDRPHPEDSKDAWLTEVEDAAKKNKTALNSVHIPPAEFFDVGDPKTAVDLDVGDPKTRLDFDLSEEEIPPNSRQAMYREKQKAYDAEKAKETSVPNIGVEELRTMETKREDLSPEMRDLLEKTEQEPWPFPKSEKTRLEWRKKLSDLITGAKEGAGKAIEGASERFTKSKDYLNNRAKEMDGKAAEMGGVEKWFRGLGEKYDKLSLIHKLGVGVTLGVGAAAFSSVSIPTALLFTGGLAVQRAYGMASMFLKIEKDLQEKKVGEKSNQLIGRKERAFLDAALYTVAMGYAVKEAVQLASETETAHTVQDWLKSHWPFGEAAAPATTVSKPEATTSPLPTAEPAVSATTPPTESTLTTPSESTPTLESQSAAIRHSDLAIEKNNAEIAEIKARLEKDQADLATGQEEVTKIATERETMAAERAASATVQAAAPSGEMPSVEARAGRGYEDMARRLFDELKEKGYDKNTFPEGSDAQRLLQADPKSINAVIHDLAEKRGFYNPNGTSFQINLGDKITLNSEGALSINDYVSAPAGAPVTPPYSPEAPAAPTPEVGRPVQLETGNEYFAPKSPAPIERIEDVRAPSPVVPVEASDYQPQPEAPSSTTVISLGEKGAYLPSEDIEYAQDYVRKHNTSVFMPNSNGGITEFVPPTEGGAPMRLYSGLDALLTPEIAQAAATQKKELLKQFADATGILSIFSKAGENSDIWKKFSIMPVELFSEEKNRAMMNTFVSSAKISGENVTTLNGVLKGLTVGPNALSPLRGETIGDYVNRASILRALQAYKP